mmetsp:Transcript_22545/g.62654  ORF Transcript_22545/g.62654 Transcript_22545/m.62654 type:complete len:838 (+) Transcript_22545:42-2555(+)
MSGVTSAMNCPNKTDPTLAVGRRIAVYFDDGDDERCKKGTVKATRDEANFVVPNGELVDTDDEEEQQQQQSRRNGGGEDGGNCCHYLIHYDDGEEEWIDLRTTKYRTIQNKAHHQKVQQERVAKLKEGCRLTVWCHQEEQYYNGTLVEKDEKRTINPHLVKYDHGDEEWLDLVFCKFRKIKAQADRLATGSRVSVWNQDTSQYDLARVIKIKPEKPRPHKVKFDDAEQGKRWMNLAAHRYLDIDHDAITTEKIKKRRAISLLEKKSNSNRPAKRSRKEEANSSDFCQDVQNANSPVERHDTEVRNSRAQPDRIQASVSEVCALCKSQARNPRATTCHHIFCRQCIRNHVASTTQLDSLQCPACNIPIQSQLSKPATDNLSFKAVEALDRSTTNVKHLFSSSSAAWLKAGFVPALIIEACKSKRRDDREHKNFYWRFKGSKDRILKAGEAIKDGVPIEQVSLETGAVLQEFSSTRKASEETGVTRIVIKRVLRRAGKADGGGFFWRFKGETHGPWADPKPSNLKPVEKLDFESGDVLELFESVEDARRSIGMSRSHIHDVCAGKRLRAGGFFWRWKGSNSLPDHMAGVEKIVQIRKRKNGPVVKEFRTSREAQAFFDYQVYWATICSYCREQSFKGGYYWNYHMLKKKKSPSEAAVGRRIRVRRPDDVHEWLDGTISCFDSATNQHEIMFDAGMVEYHNLKALKFEFKNDNGEKPVEQLDLQTGKVLRTFDSCTSAEASLAGVKGLTIQAVCKGDNRSSGGFFWRFKGSSALPRKMKGRRTIEQLSLETGKVLATFDTITEAGKAVGITTPGISYCCNGRNGSKSAGGYGWRFATGDE